jgi:hypothetical protein
MTFAMTQDECESFLAEPHVGVFAVQRETRAPMCVPLWYNYVPGGNVEIWTGAASAKVKLLHKMGRFSFCVQDETFPCKYVSVEGPVVSIRPIDFERGLVPLVERYLGRDRAASYLADYGGKDGVRDDVLVSMTPERWFSEDFSTR